MFYVNSPYEMKENDRKKNFDWREELAHSALVSGEDVPQTSHVGSTGSPPGALIITMSKVHSLTHRSHNFQITPEIGSGHNYFTNLSVPGYYKHRKLSQGNCILFRINAHTRGNNSNVN